MTKKKEKPPAEKPAATPKAETPAENNASPAAPASPEATAPKAPEGAAPAAPTKPLFGEGDGQVKPVEAPAPAATAQQPAPLPEPVNPTPAPTALIVQEPPELATLRMLSDQATAVAGIEDALTQTYQMTALMGQVTQVLNTPAIKGMVLALKGSPLGFLTDERPEKPNSVLTWEETAAACSEALVRGIPLANNHFNIIAKRCYITKNGIGYMLDKLKASGELDDYTIIQEPPQIAKGGCTVKCKISWIFRGEPGAEEMTFSCRLHDGQGADVAQGKIERKAGNWLYQRLKHIRLPDGQVAEGAEDILTTATVSAPPPPPAVGQPALPVAAPVALPQAAPVIQPPMVPTAVQPAVPVPLYPAAPVAPGVPGVPQGVPAVAPPPQRVQVDIGEGDGGMPAGAAPPVAGVAPHGEPTAPPIQAYDKGVATIKQAVAEMGAPWVIYYFKTLDTHDGQKWIPANGTLNDLDEGQIKGIGENGAKFRGALTQTIARETAKQNLQ